MRNENCIRKIEKLNCESRSTPLPTFPYAVEAATEE